MAQDRFLIAPLQSGLQTNVKPWLISDDAYATIRNAYVWRGSLRKRFGARVMNPSVAQVEQQLFTRLRINIGTTAAVTGNFALAAVPGVVWKVGQQFSIGTGATLNIFTVVNAAAGAQPMLTTGGSTGTFDTATGALAITGNNINATTVVYFYPSEPVMALELFTTNSVNDEQLIAFDTQFAYTFAFATGWQRSATGAALWTPNANQSQFYWSTNYRGAAASDNIFFVTNNLPADAMRYFVAATTTWTAWGSAGTTPINAGGDFIKTARIILPFKDRLILLNTTENIGAADQVFINRLRFSQNGSPIAADAWREDIVGKGGFLDAPIKEAIITAEFIKDRLIVYFEQSTWELVYTNNQVLPFTWQQINTELGAESMNSRIPFDKFVFGIGNRGIHSCNGINVDRIDEDIPYTIFDIKNSDSGPERVTGIRDYYVELAYWSFPSTDASDGYNERFPNRVLVYDYIKGTWAYNDDSITALGYYQLENDLTWEQIDATWEEMDLQWADPSSQARFQSVIAGNQEGFTFITDTNENNNALSLSITNITYTANTITFTVINHNLPRESYVLISNVIDSVGDLSTGLNGLIFNATATATNTFTIPLVNTFTGVYLGAGNVTRISQIDVLTKQYNFYNKVGQNIALQKIEFLVDATDNASISVDYLSSSSNIGLYGESVLSGESMGSNILQTSPYPAALAPLEQTQDRYWHYMYFNTVGENVQLRIYYSESQMTDLNVVNSDFQLNAMLFHVSPTNQLGT